jgi:hypothetical protein
MRMRHIVFCVLPGSTIFFLDYLTNDTIFEKKKLFSIKCISWFSLQRLSETFVILRKYEQDMMKNAHWSSCKVRIYPVRFQWNVNFLYRFSNNIQISNLYYESPSSGTQVAPRGRTDVTKLIVSFRNFWNSPKMVCLWESHSHERPIHYACVSSNYSLNSRMQAKILPTVSSSKYRKCWRVSCRTTLLETRNFVAALHRAQKKTGYVLVSSTLQTFTYF